MRQIENPEDVTLIEFDGVSRTAVYRGGMTRLEQINEELNWRPCGKLMDAMLDIPFSMELTLQEISEQAKAGIVTVIHEGPMECEIYQYGNYGACWYQIGETCGYA